MLGSGMSFDARAGVALAGALIAGAWLAAGEPAGRRDLDLLDRRLDGPYRLRGRERPPAAVAGSSAAGPTLAVLAARELSLVRFRYSARGSGGGGATVANLLVFQSSFVDSSCSSACGGSSCCNDSPCCAGPCNVVTLLWDELAAKPAGIEVFDGDRSLGTVLPSPDGVGSNGVRITGVPAGRYTFKIHSRDNDTSAAGTIVVLDEQPFADPTRVECVPGPVAADGTCELHVTFDNPGPLPTVYGVFVDGRLRDQICGRARTAIISGLLPGEHCVGIQGVLDTGDGLYLGCEKTTCCELDCEEPPCAPPTGVVLCQVGYGGVGGAHLFQASWTNGETYERVHVYRDGEQVGSVRGTYTRAVYPAGPGPGPYTFGLEGDCGGDVLSRRVEATITAVAETPHPDPVAGDITCEWSDLEGGTTTASWMNAAPSEFIDVYVVSGGELYLVGRVSGSAVEVSVGPTEAEDIITLQFFIYVDGACRGSELRSCGEGPSKRYLPAACNGGARLDISSGISVLNFLFQGTETPPCLAACDCNGDGPVNIADASCVFGFLFLGTRPPARWADGGCVAVLPGADCAERNPECGE
jgi:hypothetical protein